MKKIASIVLALVLVLAMAAPAMAATITIEGGHTNSVYSAYRLLIAETLTGNEEDPHYNFTVNSTYLEALQKVTGKTENDDIVKYIAALDNDGVRGFADTVYAEIKAMTADYTSAENKFTDVAPGYYLIAETKVGDAADTYSLIMLDTAAANEDEDITVKTKEDKPTVDKEVEEKNDTTGAASWGESADYDIGDQINYRITGTVSSKYADYESYYYSFSDTMVKGLTYNKDAKVYVVNGDDKYEVTDQFVIEQITAEDGQHGFTATSNLKELTLPEGVAITADTKIVVEYTVTLNAEAAIGAEGNPNIVVLEYENNPYHEADGDNNPKTPNKPDEPDQPGKTPQDVNIVFTFQTIVDKVAKNPAYDSAVEGSKQYVALEGAGFTLYKQIPGAEGQESVWDKRGEEITGVTKFEFKGLDAGIYKLSETTVPAGYNQVEDIIFEIVATYKDEPSEDVAVELIGLEVKNDVDEVISGENGTFIADVNAGSVETQVENVAGTILPSTGGVGTTVFYIVGGVLIVAAVVLLIGKRKTETK